MARSLKYLQGFVHADGGVYAEKSTHQNYETCLAIQCFVAANRDKRFEKVIKNADKYVRSLQWVNQEGTDRSEVNYGGAGYTSLPVVTPVPATCARHPDQRERARAEARHASRTLALDSAAA